MQKYQKEMKDNPSLVLQQFLWDDSIRREFSSPGLQFQIVKAEKCTGNIWPSPCSAIAGAQTA
jgi:hypothetical protein